MLRNIPTKFQLIWSNFGYFSQNFEYLPPPPPPREGILWVGILIFSFKPNKHFCKVSAKSEHANEWNCPGQTDRQTHTHTQTDAPPTVN